ncbi:MAG: hypothetical protein ABMA26_06255 [Limisphaerales bacterium]
MTRLLVVFWFAVSVHNPHAADPQLPATLMNEPGKPLLSDDFTSPTLDARWTQPKGQWRVVDGALKGLEIEAQKYGASTKRQLGFGRTSVIRYRFKMDGTKKTGINIDGAKGHICRVIIEPHGFILQKNGSSTDPSDPARLLDAAAFQFQPNEWYALTVEFNRDTVLAWIDEKNYVLGSDPKLDQEKTSFALACRGVEAKDEATFFDDVKVWEAAPRPDWAARKAKLLSQHAPAPKPPIAGPDHYKNAQAQRAKKAAEAGAKQAPAR